MFELLSILQEFNPIQTLENIADLPRFEHIAKVTTSKDGHQEKKQMVKYGQNKTRLRVEYTHNAAKLKDETFTNFITNYENEETLMNLKMHYSLSDEQLRYVDEKLKVLKRDRIQFYEPK